MSRLRLKIRKVVRDIKRRSTAVKKVDMSGEDILDFFDRVDLKRMLLFDWVLRERVALLRYLGGVNLKTVDCTFFGLKILEI
jgi:hypothetical protein